MSTGSLRTVDLTVACGTRNEADIIAREGVERGLAASAHILPVSSYYRWEGEVVSAEETLLVFHSTTQNIVELVALIESLHTYEVPAIRVHSVNYPTQEATDWVLKACSQDSALGGGRGAGRGCS